ncbi:branched-chain amino acid ABC transporter permease [Streptomyces sulfonofaciens]|uniref:Branched-chain amino acid ABC transporter permease n=1 Tax=Streptomyces sulfonofaciens TaxID=68272 RepID=A0A919FY89_9ACTN|nr:branched-chain amino acid ABC transporter permease [Streptomyces sulfonofaciens]GHH74026.1 branched-chain amino acid ABC transporter permease [Streptomyces sulfonofaciens]
MTTIIEPTEPAVAATPARGLLPLPTGLAKALVPAGGLITVVSAFLPWTWTSEFAGDLTVYGYPAGLQTLAIVAGVLALAYGLGEHGVPGLRWTNPGKSPNALFLAALTVFAVTWYTGIAITVELGGLVNLEPGGFIAMAGGLIGVVGALGLPQPADNEATGLAAYVAKPAHVPDAELPGAWIQRLILTAAVALGLVVFTYGIGIDPAESETFIGFVLLVAIGAWTLNTSGLLARYSRLSAGHRGFATTMAFVAAVIFPFTQSDDHNANLGVNILIFATVALGLNIVVGLTGLLDLGYVAFLGVGAYAAALVSGSEFSRFSGVHVPFWGAALIGMGASLVFGVLIGAPTLRLRGDYLAIVTLGFGEIFRIAVNNMDGSSGPDITNGPDGITNVPDLKLFGFDFAQAHEIGPFTIGRFANYFFLMLLFTAIVVLVFTRAADSRIGRSWVAIREDETAATAMGINGFRVKLVAFALGATLAGLAGTVYAHETYGVVPNPYQFAGAAPPNSAFLLAAVVLGGMGTVGGPLLGASLLYLIPEKLGFLKEYELLAFGVALILLMRFRPEGIISDSRKKLEFRATGQMDVPDQTTLEPATGVAKAGG